MTQWFESMHRDFGRLVILAFFILCALPVGVMTALITPPGQSPDEPAHLARAAGLLHGAILGVRKTDTDPNTGKPEQQAGVKVDTGLFVASFGAHTEIDNRPVVTQQDFQAMRAQAPDHNKVFANLPNTATYFPATYVPATLGLALGLVVKAKPFTCFLLARFFMLAAFLVLGLLALWITAFGEAVLLTVLLMPMTLFLAGTVNQDGVLIAMACLACAALTRNSRTGWLLGLAVFVLFLGSKPPYILLLGAFLLPLFGPGFWRRVRDVAIACVPVLIWVGLVVALVLVPYSQTPHHPGPLYAGDHSVWLDHADAAANFHILLAQPARFITLPWHTTVVSGLQRLRETVGVLGLLQIQLPDFYDQIWGICGAVALLGLVFCRRPVLVTPGVALVNFLFVVFLLVATCWLIFIVLYLDWTFVGKDFIDGPQGRYFLPLLPFLILAIPEFRWRFKIPLLLPALPTIALGVFDIGYIPMKLVWNYYLH